MANAQRFSVDEANGVWRLDAAAFLPEPSGNVALGGEDYPLFPLLDLPYLEGLRISKLDAELREHKGTYEEQLEGAIEIILTMNRGPVDGRGGRRLLTADQLKALAPNQIIMLRALALTEDKKDKPPEGEGPSTAAGDGSASPSSSPASADSTAGRPAAS